MFFWCMFLTTNYAMYHKIVSVQSMITYDPRTLATSLTDRNLTYSWQRPCIYVIQGCNPRGVHYDNIRKQRAGKYRVIYIHKRKNL
jgi:hypothetical protein